MQAPIPIGLMGKKGQFYKVDSEGAHTGLSLIRSTSYVIRLLSAVCALSQSQSCLESWDLYLSVAALSVIKGFSFESRSSFRLDENTIKSKHCVLASSAICEIIYSHDLTSETRALRWKTVVTYTPPTCL